MGKGLLFNTAGAAKESVRREHASGAIFWIWILTVQQLTALQELMAVPVLVRDEKGQVVYNRRGEPGVRYRQDIGALVHFLATEVIDRIENVFDQNGNPVQWTPELVEQFLNTMPAKPEDAVIGWVISQAIEIGTDNAKAEAKN